MKGWWRLRERHSAEWAEVYTLKDSGEGTATQREALKKSKAEKEARDVAKESNRNENREERGEKQRLSPCEQKKSTKALSARRRRRIMWRQFETQKKTICEQPFVWYHARNDRATISYAACRSGQGTWCWSNNL